MRTPSLCTAAVLFSMMAEPAAATEITTQLSIFNPSGASGTVRYTGGSGSEQASLKADQTIWSTIARFTGISVGGVFAHTTPYELVMDFGNERTCTVTVLSTVSPAPACHIFSQQFFDPGACSATIAMASTGSTCGMTLTVRPVD